MFGERFISFDRIPSSTLTLEVVNLARIWKVVPRKRLFSAVPVEIRRGERWGRGWWRRRWIKRNAGRGFIGGILSFFIYWKQFWSDPHPRGRLRIRRTNRNWAITINTRWWMLNRKRWRLVRGMVRMRVSLWLVGCESRQGIPHDDCSIGYVIGLFRWSLDFKLDFTIGISRERKIYLKEIYADYADGCWDIIMRNLEIESNQKSNQSNQIICHE